MSNYQRKDDADGMSGQAPVPYVVTRGSPPREYQFKKGESGNKKGRPKGSKNFRTLLEQELDRKIPVNIGGQTEKITKRQALIMRLVDKGLKGELKAIQFAIRYEDEGRSDTADTLPPFDADPQRDAELLASYLERVDENESGHA